MPLSQKGAGYDRRSVIGANLKAHDVQAALDDVASQIQAVRSQGNFGRDGKIPAPSAPTNLLVENQNSIYTATITHDAPVGTKWLLYYSADPTFQQGVITADLGESKTWQHYLPGLKLYFRVTAKFPSSDPSSPTYFLGSNQQPQAL